jgi:hypothetical protein
MSVIQWVQASYNTTNQPLGFAKNFFFLFLGIFAINGIPDDELFLLFYIVKLFFPFLFFLKVFLLFLYYSRSSSSSAPSGLDVDK